MLDFAAEETTLDTKRRELASKITEGRQVVAALSERQTAIHRKIEEAMEAIGRLQEQLKAIDTVRGLGVQDIAFQPPRPAIPVLEVVPTPAPQPAEPLRVQPFRPMAYLKCLAGGHELMNSRSMPGYVTCRRCKMRRRG